MFTYMCKKRRNEWNWHFMRPHHKHETLLEVPKHYAGEASVKIIVNQNTSTYRIEMMAHTRYGQLFITYQ